MKTNCKQCQKEIPVLSFTEAQKLDLYVLMQNDLKVFAEKKLTDDFQLTPQEAKTIVAHLNNRNGHCAACDCTELETEYTVCPKCGAYNYNLNEPAFNINFCSHLEWYLDFKKANDEKAKDFWCDGINHLPKDVNALLPGNIAKNKQLTTKAYLGNDGQDIYEMTITFGEQAVQHYLTGQNLIDCIPGAESPNWITINIQNKTITVALQ